MLQIFRMPFTCTRLLFCTTALLPFPAAQSSSAKALDAESHSTSASDTPRTWESQSLIYPAQIPAGGLETHFGRHVAIDGDIMVGLDGPAELWFQGWYRKSGRGISYVKTAQGWQYSGQIRPYWSHMGEYAAKRVAVTGNLVIMLGDVFELPKQLHSRLDLFGWQDGSWQPIATANLNEDTGRTLRARHLAMVGSRVVVENHSADGSILMFYELSASGLSFSRVQGPIPELGGIGGFAASSTHVVLGLPRAPQGGKIAVLDAQPPYEVTLLDNPSPSTLEWFGQPVDIEGNVIVAVAAEINSSNSQRSILSFVGTPDGWALSSTLSGPTSPYEAFGQCLDLDEDTLLVCHSTYTRDLSAYRMQGSIIAAQPHAHYGFPYTMEGRGIWSLARSQGQIVAGHSSVVEWNSKTTGALALFEEVEAGSATGTWIRLGDNREEHYFGYSIATSGEWMAVGVPGRKVPYNGGMATSGSIRIYRRTGNGWSFFQELTDGIGSGFGYWLAFKDDSLVATGYSPTSLRSYVKFFQRVDSQWYLARTLWFEQHEGAPIAIGGDYAVSFKAYPRRLSIRSLDASWSVLQDLEFDEPDSPSASIAVSAAENYFVVKSQDSAGTHLRVFEPVDGMWAERARLRYPGILGEEFGGPVITASDEGVVVSAYTPLGRRSVFFFGRNNGVWAEPEELPAPEDSSLEAFGLALAVAGGKILVGSGSCISFPYCEVTGEVVVYAKENGAWGVERLEVVSADSHTTPSSMLVAGSQLLLGLPYSDPLKEGAIAAGQVLILDGFLDQSTVFADGFELAD